MIKRVGCPTIEQWTCWQAERVTLRASLDGSVEALVLGAWSAVGLGAALGNGAYSPFALVLVALGTGLLLVAAVSGWRARNASPTVVRVGVTVALATAVAVAALLPAGLYGSGPWLTASHVLTLLAAAVLAGWFLLRLARPWIAAIAAIALQAMAGVAMIRSSPRPRIDDWFMLQAAAHGLSRGQNIYSVAWIGPPHESSNLFAYLPGSAVLVWPFHALFGDVRYGILTVLVATCIILVVASRKSPFCLLGALPLLYPKVLFGLEQSWIDPLVLLGVCGACLAVSRGHPAWAVVSFAAALACKQQAWLVVPVAMAWKEFGWRRAVLSSGLAGVFVLPWALDSFHRFFFDVFQYQLHLPARLDSLSFFPAAIASGLHPRLGWLVVATFGALVVVLLRVRRDTAGFLLGAALVMCAFNVMNKQSFFNEWELAAGLASAAVVFGASSVGGGGGEVQGADAVTSMGEAELAARWGLQRASVFRVEEPQA